MATLMKHLPYSGPEEINELKRIAVRFEEKVFSSAVYQVIIIIHTSFSVYRFVRAMHMKRHVYMIFFLFF